MELDCRALRLLAMTNGAGLARPCGARNDGEEAALAMAGLFHMVRTMAGSGYAGPAMVSALADASATQSTTSVLGR